MNNAVIQNLDNMPFDAPPVNTLRVMAGEDYVQNLPEDFWSPCFGQPENRHEAYNFNFEVWRRHYDARKMAMQFHLEYQLSQGRTILTSFDPLAPTADFSEPHLNGASDTLWNVKGIRRLDKNGVIKPGVKPFLDEYMTPEYLAEHLTNRIFGFRMRVATWLESEAA